MERISLCLIVRDEERFLPGCLESARGRVDEIVVVDTGSRDRTVAIAEDAGARVVPFPWVDDFAAARNAALDAATGTHVLVLDADERLADDGGALRAASRDTSLVVGLLPLHDASALEASPGDVVSGRARLWEPSWLPRFFRRDPRLRYTRRVHETIFGDPRALAEMLRAPLAGGGRARIGPVEAPIVHYGEVPALRAERAKRARNTRLLEMALAEDPADGDLAGYLAAERHRAGDVVGARAVGERHLGPYLAALARTEPGVPKGSPVQLASVLAKCCIEQGESARAVEVVRAAAAECVEPHPNLRYLEGVALERLGRADEARAAFEDCLAWHGRKFLVPAQQGVTSSAPRLRLAALALAQGDARAATAHLDGHGPFAGAFAVPAQLLRAEAHVVLGRPADALAALQPLFARPSPPPDLFAIAARAAELLGAPDPALRSAASRAPAGAWLEPRRLALVANARG